MLVRQRSFFGVCAFALALALGGRPAEASPSSPTLIVVDVEGTTLDAARVRAAVGKELGATPLAPEDPRAQAASGRIAIEAKASKLTVTYRKKGGAPGEAITRSVDLPATPERVESSAVILASNVARDEAGDLLATLKPPAPVTKPTPPTVAQTKALAVLTDEVNAYEKGARDYRETVAQIARLHHETKRKELLASKERELSIEKAELVRARAIAIARLEELIAKYAGDARPEVPDAMYRLAALYEERARSEDTIVPLERGLSHTIRLYKRILREYPTYKESAGVHYFLGHALNDAGRVPEAQQVWRSLVCKNHFAYPVAAHPNDPERDVILPLPQDASEASWTEWRRRHSDPKSPKASDPETVFVDPFPNDCKPVAQPSQRPGDEPRYVAETWWQIGNWELDGLDVGSGVTKGDPQPVWGLNRAASAYVHARAFKKPPIAGVALYKHAWTLYKQQRYELATKAFLELLEHTDAEAARTGDRGADFRSEAFTYIGASLANVDFKGPEAWEPFIPRPDILDAEPDRDRAEKKLRVAMDRVNDPKIIPQEKPWTIEIYRALALELRGLDQLANAIALYETMLRRWPLHPTAPDIVAAIADAWDQTYVARRIGTPEHEAAAQKALEARTRLADYVASSAAGNRWVDANKDDPNALRNAERLVRSGLRQAAAQHTNRGRAALALAQGASMAKVDHLVRATNEYELAARGFQGYVALDRTSDAYESRYWLADARHNHVRLKVKLHEARPQTHAAPSKKEIDEALLAAIDVRDTTEATQYLDNAAFFVVDLTDVERDLAYAGGTPRRSEVKFDRADAETRKVVKDPIPAVVQQSMKAREDYARVVPPALDANERAQEYRFWIAETYFLYGHWDLAKARFEAMWKERCGVDRWGSLAWNKLVTMAAKERDEARALALVDAVDPAKGGRSCNANEEQRLGEPVRQAATLERARRRFAEVCDASGPDKTCKDAEASSKRAAWREVGALFEAALDGAPASDGAPEGAERAAQAYRLAGDLAKSIALSQRFLRDYGAKVETKRAEAAWEGLAAAQYAMFDYSSAAETYAKIGENERFDPNARRAAAKNAIVLHASAGRRAPLLAAHRTFLGLRPSTEERAEADHRVSTFDWRQWDKTGRDTGQNRDIRRRAEAALVQFWNTHRNEGSSAKYLVEVAHAIAELKNAGPATDAREWLSNVVVAWDAMKKNDAIAAQRTPHVDWAAEAAYTLIDSEITRRFDAPEKHVYPARVPEILGASGVKGRYALLADEAQAFDKRLQEEVVQKYESLAWVPAAIARQGAIYDVLRSGLYDTTKVKTLSVEAERLVAGLRVAGQGAQADTLEDTARDVWLEKKRQELDAADELMVRRYATALAYAKKYDVKGAALAKAASRLAHYTDVLGDDKLRALVTKAPHPITKGAMLPYTTKMYGASRPGIVSPPQPTGETKLPPTKP